MPDPTPIVYGTVLGLVLLLLAFRPWQRGPVSDGGAILASSGFSLAYLAGWFAQNGWPPLEPTNVVHWLVYLIPAATLVVVAQRKGARWPVVWLLRGALVTGFLTVAFAPVADYREWEGSTRLLAAGLLFLSGLWTLALTEVLARRAGDPAELEPDDRGAGIGPPLVLMVQGGVAAGLLGTTSGVSALNLGAMCTFFGITCALALLRGEKAYWRGATTPYAFGLWALLFVATFYGALEPLPAGLVLLAPLGALVPLGNLHGLRAALIRVLLVGAVGALALWLGWPEPDPYGY